MAYIYLFSYRVYLNVFPNKIEKMWEYFVKIFNYFISIFLYKDLI